MSDFHDTLSSPHGEGVTVVVAPDSFKESLSAPEAAAAIAAGVRAALPHAQVLELPLSDGGEGFARTVTAAWGGRWVEVDSTDALGRPRRSGYGLSPDGRRAVVDLAESVGLEHIAEADRDVTRSSTAGLGTVIAAVADSGAGEALVGLGGSASNDLGLGMLAALGARILDADGEPVAPIPAAFDRIVSIDAAPARERLAGLRLTAACDVTNPLLGTHGATVVFGPQKGIRPEEVGELDAALSMLAGLLGGDPARPGTGAAGGTGFALTEVLAAELRPGFDCAAEAVGLAEAIAGAALVLTGEGALDGQSADGKTVSGVVGLAREAGVPVVAFGGVVRPGAERLGVPCVGITPEGMPLSEALARGGENLETAVARELERRSGR